MRYALLLVVLALGACSRSLEPTGGCGDSTIPAVCGTCAAHTDVTSCEAAGCVAGPLCCGATFNGCYAEGTHFAPCSTDCPVDCAALDDEQSCDAQLANGTCHATFIDGAFETCKPGAPQCDGLSTFACESGQPEVSCGSGFIEQYDDQGCVIDCIPTDDCPPAQ